MKGSKEGPPIAAMADIEIHYSQYSKHFIGIRNDLNRSIILQEQITKQLAELICLTRTMPGQLAKYRGGQS